MTKKRDYDKWQTIDGIIDMGVKEIIQMYKNKILPKICDRYWWIVSIDCVLEQQQMTWSQ